METMTPVQDGSEVENRYHEVIADLTNELLDSYYEANPYSNAFGMRYENPNDVDGVYYIGRENGREGAEDEIGFDYFYRKFQNPESRTTDTEYIYGKYGWMDINNLIEESNLLRQIFEAGVKNDHLSERDLERFNTSIENIRDSFRGVRDQYNLSDIAGLIREHEIETLRSLLGHGEEESRTIWQLLFSKDEDGDHIENTLEIPVISEMDQFMFVRSERYYYDDDEKEGSWYSYGAVIGCDDTPERFFIHRLSSDTDLRDEEIEWTAALVKEKMGFDDNLHEVGDDMPFDRRIRVQGDLTVTRRDYDDALSEYSERKFETIRKEHGRDYMGDFLETHPVYEETDGIAVNSGYVNFYVKIEDTDALKELQDDLGINEKTVREEQEQRGISRLTAKRRNDIITDICEERAFEWCVDKARITEDEIQSSARELAQDDFEDTQKQVNTIIGNHTMIGSNIRSHPNRLYGDGEALEVFVVPEEETVFLIHDEHEDKHFTLKPGIYEWKFLQGYEDEFWM